MHGTLASDDSHDAVWYTPADEVAIPPYPSEWGSGIITSINNDGSVYVGYGIVGNGSESARYPFMSRDEDFEELDVPDEFYDAIPAALNGNGQRWIGSARDSVSNDSEAVIWDEAGGMRSLAAELAARGLELPIDAALPSARLISNNGRVIILEATNLAPFTRIELAD